MIALAEFRRSISLALSTNQIFSSFTLKNKIELLYFIFGVRNFCSYFPVLDRNMINSAIFSFLLGHWKILDYFLQRVNWYWEHTLGNCWSQVLCILSRVIFYLPFGEYQIVHPAPSGWTHFVLNYNEPDRKIMIFYNGAEVESVTIGPTWGISAGAGRIVVGRLTDRDEGYGSVQVDELIYFNQSLRNHNVKALYTDP